ncbi:MAG: hypothetical protein IJ146_14740 [Kiritimatiellae bacterium]|nr:hypothetical protein [Kiritimatiellia bacterium]
MLMTRKELAAACSLLVAGAVFGASEVVKESFEAKDAGAAVTELGQTWTGSASGAGGEYAATAGGLVLPDAAHTKILSIDDAVKYTPANATEIGKPVLVDMMVQAMVPEEALAAPEEDAENPVQIAVGVDKSSEGKGMLKVFCMPKGASAAAWCALKEVEASSWHRVTFVFDYAAGFAQVRIDGEPVMTDSGYLTADASQEKTGAWYKLAVTKNQLASVEVVGTTGLDDLLITAGDNAQADANVEGSTTIDGVAIPNAWFDMNGLAWVAGAYDDSGLTIAQKYESGLSPFDGAKFVITDMTMSGENAELTIPVVNPPTGYTVILECSSDPEFKTEVTSVPVTVDANGKVTVPVPADKDVVYYRLTSKKSLD